MTWSSDFEYSKEYHECTGNDSTCGGYERDDPIIVNDNFVKWLESLIDKNKLAEALKKARLRKDKEEKSQEKNHNQKH